MTEAEYIEATNLAKIRIAYDAMASVIGGYEPVTEVKRVELISQLGNLLDECFKAIKTEVE